jgi:hypothetical protein
MFRLIFAFCLLISLDLFLFDSAKWRRPGIVFFIAN